MRGQTAFSLAHEIHDEWGDLKDMTFNMLRQLLNRQRLMMGERAEIKMVEAQWRTGLKPILEITMLGKKSINALSELVALSKVQQARVQALWKQEQEQGTHDGRLNDVISDYRTTLQAVQKMQFDLGVDEFRGPINTTRGFIDKRTLPDGTHQERHVYEAVSAVEDIFRQREITPELTDGD